MYTAKYLIYEYDGRNLPDDPVECEINGYESVEALKGETTEVIEKLINNYKIPNGLVDIEMSIEKNGEYFDCDSGNFMIEDGKIKML